MDGTPRPAPANPAGQAAIAYRVRTYASSLQQMKQRIASLRKQDGSIGRLNLYADQSWALGLLESWAMTMDILSFYQERIANEGYLRTATEQRSVQELVSMIGYEPPAGVAASTYLAFTVRELPATPSRRCPIPRGTVVQSIPAATNAGRATGQQPGPAQMPQTFETDADFVARSEWNILKPALTAFKDQHGLSCHITSLRLAGTSTGLRQGDAILLVGNDAANGTAPGHEPAWLFAILTGVVINRGRNFTSVTWEASQTNCAAHTLIDNPQVFALRQKAALHCSARAGLYYSPLTPAPAWSPVSSGLPAMAIHALVAHKTGAIFAATASGVFRSTNKGESWEMTRVGLMNTKVSALAVGEDGRLYAGTTTGNVFCSGDNGESWRLLVSKPGQRITLLGLAIPGQSVSVMSLPKSAIHRLVTFVRHRRLHIAVAMDDGVFVSADQGKSWRKAACGQNKARGGSVAAWSLLQGSHPGKILAGLDTGLFHLKMPHVLPQWWTNTLKWTAVVLVLLMVLEGIGQAGLSGIIKPVPLLGTLLLPFLMAHSGVLFPLLLTFLLLLLLLGGWWFIEQRLHTRAVLARGTVRAMTALDDGTLVVATDQGFFRSRKQGRHWEAVAQEQSAPQAGRVRVLRADAQKNLVAGLEDGSIYLSRDGGAQWENYAPVTSLADIQDLALHNGGIFAAGSPLNSDLDGQWSRFHLQQ
ncbi:MAG TPA: hypothetical protein VHD63_05380, partial [Ktedonobacteraceae bacterium]|nr:hypothetical protein [Ktedonobacteraceae bacterium]